MNPRDPFRHVNRAAAFVESDHPSEAIAQYESKIKVSSNPTIRARCYESIAAISDELGDFAKVRDNYRLALQADPGQAADMTARVSQDAVTSPSAPHYLQLGMLLQEVGKLDEARIAYMQALKLDPGLTIAKEPLGALARSQK